MAETEPGADDGEDFQELARQELDRPLPPAVRRRVVDFASDALGLLPTDQVPAVLRQVARFEPKRRARLAGSQIGAQLETNHQFRAQVAAQLALELPELAEALGSGSVPSVVEPVTVAAAAYLLRGPDWPDIVVAAEQDLRQQEDEQARRVAEASVHSVQEQLDRTRAEAQEERKRLRSEARAARSTIADLRRALHAERTRAKRAEEQVEHAEQERSQETTRLQEQLAATRTETRRLQDRLATVEAQAEGARRAARAGRSTEDARVRMLLDVLQDAAHGLRRELDLPNAIERPADFVTEASGNAARSDDAERGTAVAPAAGRPDDDPGVLDEVLRMPQVHLLVDGYNVTKTAYPALTLAEQRVRLMTGLEGMATRTRAEITCVFDGADVASPPAAAPMGRRARLVFSAPDETADTLLLRIVRAEPAGRPVAVVSSDAEIASAVRRCGARSLPAAVLVRGLGERTAHS